MSALAEDWREGGFGVYVHWPFCASKCPYCDFNSHVRREIDQTAWRDALVRDLHTTAAQIPDRRVDTVFFGGGTPSLMPPETVSAVIAAIRSVWTLDEDAEITLEANPTSVEAARFSGYRDAGVNRVSMGIQALNDPDLKALGRLHTVAEAEKAFDLARAIFPRVSFDLIYARQLQSLEEWTSELQRALAMAADHLSLYQLTIEDGTRFGALAALGRLRGLPDDDLSADMYLATQDICNAAGMPAYEISNHAKPGAQGRHNLIYWRSGDYAGVGPGAHGRLSLGGQRWATESHPAPEDWLSAVRETGSGLRERVSVTGEDRGVEMLLMGMRLVEGVKLARFNALSGRSLSHEALDELVSLGMITVDTDQICTTEKGRPLLNAILKRLLFQ